MILKVLCKSVSQSNFHFQDPKFLFMQEKTINLLVTFVDMSACMACMRQFYLLTIDRMLGTNTSDCRISKELSVDPFDPVGGWLRKQIQITFSFFVKDKYISKCIICAT
jgi:hypothetical protein